MCSRCAAGTYSSTSGLGACSDCEAGAYSSSGASEYVNELSLRCYLFFFFFNYSSHSSSSAWHVLLLSTTLLIGVPTCLSLPFFFLLSCQIKLHGLPRGPVFVHHSRVYMCCVRRRPVPIAACPKRLPRLRLGFLRGLERDLNVHRLPGGTLQRRRGFGVCGVRGGLRGLGGSVFFLLPL